MKRLLTSHRAILLCVGTAVAVYLGVRADHRWIAHDEGLLAHSAERGLDGRLPHRDFDGRYRTAKPSVRLRSRGGSAHHDKCLNR